MSAMIPLVHFLADTATTKPAYRIDWDNWLAFPGWPQTFAALSTFAAIVFIALIVGRIFRRFFRRKKLFAPFIFATAVFSLYFSILALQPQLLITPKDKQDLLAVIIHRVFVALFLFIIIRFIDRVIVVHALTRGGRLPLSRFIHQVVVTIIFFFFVAGYLHWAFDFEISSVLAGSAIVSIILGLALQETLGNFFSGMVIQTSAPFSLGDWIQIGDIEGRVVDVTWRAVTLRTNSNNHVLIPNSVISKDRIINYHTPTPATAFSITVGVDYEIPPNDVKRVLSAAAAETADVLKDPAPSVAVAAFDDSAITYRVIFWIIEPFKHGGVEEAVRTNCWYRLKQAGYNIPFPMRTVEMIDSSKKQHRQQESDVARRLAALTGPAVFDRLTPDQKKRLAENTRDFSFSAGQIIYRQGDVGSSTFILLTGALDVYMKADDGKEYDVDDIIAPALFGELSAMTDHPRAETIRAQSDVTVIEITREHVRQLITESPHLADPVAEIVAKRHADRHAKLQQLSAPTAPAPAPETHTAVSILSRMRRLFGGH